MAAHLLAVVALLLAATRALAYPYLFISDIAGSDCTAVPLTAYGAHSPPQPDPDVRFSLRDAATGAAAGPDTGVCAGSSYVLSLTFPTSMRYLLTASVGNWSSPFDASCRNRAATPQRGPSSGTTPSVTNTLALPCNAAGSLRLLVRAASWEVDYYHAAELSLPVNPNCAAAQCGGAPAVPSPVPSPSPSPVPSPSPSPVPNPSPSPVPSPRLSPAPSPRPSPLSSPRSSPHLSPPPTYPSPYGGYGGRSPRPPVYSSPATGGHSDGNEQGDGLSPSPRTSPNSPSPRSGSGPPPTTFASPRLLRGS